MQVALNPCAYPLANRELTVKCLTIVNSMRQLKSIKVGVNETIKSIEKEVSNLVLISADSEPFEIVQILPELCEEKVFYFTKESDLYFSSIEVCFG
mmetsp:Transcript_2378/g.4364  ORF Transcript_2378/g.4364 Transcript_2378/m.4364 type:complete len:96 (+) Transcript_2378:293-580(+)